MLIYLLTGRREKGKGEGEESLTRMYLIYIYNINIHGKAFNPFLLPPLFSVNKYINSRFLSFRFTDSTVSPGLGQRLHTPSQQMGIVNLSLISFEA